jgi:hypothetical protein
MWSDFLAKGDYTIKGPHIYHTFLIVRFAITIVERERERERGKKNGLQSYEWVGNQIHLQCSRRPLGHKIVWCFCMRTNSSLKLFPHSDHLVALHTRPTLVVYTLFKISSEVEVSLDSGVSHFPLLFCRVFCGLSSKVDWHL